MPMTRRTGQKYRAVWLLAGGLAVALTVAVLAALYFEQHDPGPFAAQTTTIRVVYLGLFATLLIASVVVHWRVPPGRTLRYAAIWLGLGAVLMFLYGVL